MVPVPRLRPLLEPVPLLGPALMRTEPPTGLQLLTEMGPPTRLGPPTALGVLTDVHHGPEM